MKVKMACLECRRQFIYKVDEIRPLIRYCSSNCYVRKKMVISKNAEKWDIKSVIYASILGIVAISLIIKSIYR